MAFHVGIDVGGTFTDLFAVDDQTGAVVSEKADTTADAVSGVLSAIRLSGIATADISTFVFGSTVATNALIERTLPAVAFLGTAGFTDTLEIRRVWRRHLFGWHWDRPRSLAPRPAFRHWRPYRCPCSCLAPISPSTMAVSGSCRWLHRADVS